MAILVYDVVAYFRDFMVNKLIQGNRYIKGVSVRKNEVFFNLNNAISFGKICLKVFNKVLA